MSAAKACALAVLLAACTSDGGAAASSTTDSAVTVPSTTTTVSQGDTTTTGPPSGETSQLAQYLATIEQSLEGTGLEGAAFDEPESLIRTGVLFCDLLDEGFGPIDVLRGWVAALSTDSEVPSEDDLLLGGVVLGSAVKFLCPEHLDDLALARPTTAV